MRPIAIALLIFTIAVLLLAAFAIKSEAANVRNQYIVVYNEGGSYLSVISTANNSYNLYGTVVMPDIVTSITTNSLGTNIYALCTNGYLYEIRVQDLQITRNCFIGDMSAYSRMSNTIEMNGIFGIYFDTAYVPDYDGYVFEVNLTTMTRGYAYPVNGGACSVEISTHHSTSQKILAVTNMVNHQIQFINTSNHTVFKTITLPADIYPTDIFLQSYDEDSEMMALVAGWTSDNVTKIDCRNNTIVGNVSLGPWSTPTRIVYGGDYLYVTGLDNNVSIITNMFSSTEGIPDAPAILTQVNMSGTIHLGIGGQTFSPDNEKYYVTQPGNNTVSIYDHHTEGLPYYPNPFTSIVNLSGFSEPREIFVGYLQIETGTQIVQIKVQDDIGAWTGIGYDVSAYQNGQYLSTSVTDDSGVATFILSPTGTYNFVVNGSGINTAQTFTISPAQQFYTIKIPYLQILGISTLADKFLNQTQHAAIRYNIDNCTLNLEDGYANFNCSYQDGNLLTTAVTYSLYVNNSSTDNGPAVLIGQTTVSGSSSTANFTYPNGAGKSYHVEYAASQTTGSNKTFYNSVATPGPKWWAGLLPLTWYWYFAFIPTFIIMGAGVATKKGLIAMCGVGAAALANEGHWWEITPVPGVYMPQLFMWGILALCFMLCLVMMISEREKYT